MSHEIRTPLNAILGMTHLLLRTALDRVQQDRLAKVEGAARHLLAILNDVLDLSKIEAGRLELEEAAFHLHEVLARALDLFSDQAQQKKLALRFDAGDAPLRLVGDATRLSQALINLLSNAVKFTQAGSVALRARTVSRNLEEVLLRFEVSDTGPGVPAETQLRLFRAFQQADNSTTRRHGGTGLGLALTRELATAMGGEVGVDSSEGAGSTFWFTAKFRLSSVASSEASKSTVTPRDQNSSERILRMEYAGRRVLVAEDNIVNQEVVAELLSVVGLVAVLAEDGEEATRLALNFDFDVVLMDVQMPGVDGIEETRRIRDRQCRTPIIAVTANTFTEEREACLAAGMNDHLSKPVRPDALYAVLLRWLSADRRGT